MPAMKPLRMVLIQNNILTLADPGKELLIANICWYYRNHQRLEAAQSSSKTAPYRGFVNPGKILYELFVRLKEDLSVPYLEGNNVPSILLTAGTEPQDPQSK